jgi:hypothetical protein
MIKGRHTALHLNSSGVMLFLFAASLHSVGRQMARGLPFAGGSLGQVRNFTNDLEEYRVAFPRIPLDDYATLRGTRGRRRLAGATTMERRRYRRTERGSLAKIPPN